MSKKIYLLFVICALLPKWAGGQAFEIPVTVSDGETSAELTIGVHPEASADFDDNYDADAPPPSLSGFNAWLVRAELPSKKLAVDIVGDAPGQKLFELEYEPGVDAGPIQLSWNPDDLPSGVPITIEDTDQDGSPFSLDMSTNSELDTTVDPDLKSGLKIRVELRSQMEVVTPNGGETWQFGTTHTIEWSAKYLSTSTIDIELLRNGSLVEPIVEGTADDGTYDWTLPTDLTPSSGYEVRVTSSDGSVTDQSDETFSLETPPKPDLVVTSLTFHPSNPTTDETVTAEHTIENQGTAETPSFAYQLLYNGAEIDRGMVPSLVPGGAVKVSYDLGTNPSGTIPITVEADPDNAITESEEANNELTEILQISSIATLELGKTVESLSGSRESEQDFRLPGTELSTSESNAKSSTSKWAASEDISPGAVAASVRISAGAGKEQVTNRAGQQLPIVVKPSTEQKETASKNVTTSKSGTTSVSAAEPDVLRFSIEGGSGDADLYVRFGAPPKTDEYDCRPYLVGNDETCEFSDPASGDWYVMIRGFEAYSGVRLLAEASEAPVVDQTIPDLTGDDALTIGVDLPIVQFGDAFSDPNDDPLNLSVSSSDEGIVTAVMDGENLILSPQSVGGPTEIEIVADDGLTSTATTFDVDVAEAELSSPPAFESAALVGGNGSTDMGSNVAVDVDLSEVTGSGLIRTSWFDEPPTNFNSEISEENVSQYRWTIGMAGGLNFGNQTEVRFSIDEVEEAGIIDDNSPGSPGIVDDADNVAIYRRNPSGEEDFVRVCAVSDDCYDEQSSELVATVSSLGEFVLASDTEPLPVDLVTFKATLDGETVQLSWQTASETQNAGFAVQRRVEATDSFSRIGFVEGAGTSSKPRSYQFDDADFPFDAEHVTYRLKQVDLDGSSRYSSEVEVALGTPERYALHGNYPNPVHQRTTIRYELPQSSEVQLVVYDVLGQRVATLAAEQQASGRKEVVFDTSGLASGTYFYRLEANDHVSTRSMTVVR